MAPPEKLEALVDRFHRNRDAYRTGDYNETQVRREFIDPLFKLLGWDVDNEQGYSEAYKDVVHEDAIKIGGATKAPDYSFRVGGARKFFVEAKKPSVDIKHDIHPAYQLRRYAWSAKLPLSILTDFEEFSVYDCNNRPVKNDKASTGRIKYIRYDEYVDRWDELVEIFSRDAILKGAFDRYADSTKKKRGTAEVDDAFLQDIEGWRDLLARNIALRNENLSQRELNFAVQRTIDRIIFLRICEDRGVEDYGQLRGLLNGSHIYGRLLNLYYRADEKYNSGLFHFEDESGREDAPDELTPQLEIDDKALKEIIGNLYYPDSPYEFSVLPADILGQVYEQFLGKVIRLTAGHRAKVEEKPEVRKAGGVHYTPTYIVEYIVEQTVGQLLEGSTPKKASKLRILDPACGSGSFLIGAYQYLLDWHRDWYTEHGTEKHADVLYQGQAGDWRLTTAEKKRILLNNIYGVDIDAQAVEVTKLSLLLKVLEGENEETLHQQMKFFHERALPSLDENIKCGNSLIAPDYYDGEQLGLMDEEELYRINVFDWEDEFAGIMDNGGFDAVIGNPPYVRQEMLSEFKEYFKVHYKVYHGYADLYAYFIEQGLSLLRDGGLFGYIVANKWMRANYGKPLREFLQEFAIREIVDFDDYQVFKNASTYPMIMIVKNRKPINDLKALIVDENIDTYSLRDSFIKNSIEVFKNSLNPTGWNLISKEEQSLAEKINNTGKKLVSIEKYEIHYGIKTGRNKAFVIDTKIKNRLVEEDENSTEVIKPFVVGRDVNRYKPLSPDKFVIFTRRGINIEKYPAIKSYLENYKEILEPKPKGYKGKWAGRKSGNYKWYEIQDTVDYYQAFEKQKVVIPTIIKEASFTFDIKGIYSNDKTSIIENGDKFLLGILNSKILEFIMSIISSTKRGGYYEYKPMYIERLPIYQISENNNSDKTLKSDIEQLADRMLALHTRLRDAATDQECTVLQRRITATDREIDQLVYELYDLTDDEIGIVEKNIG
ncbi:MAG: N-6 DNA methylase [Candidatus Marinimicrobia bacterium]|nr:N-6 DNA methylase [Candidatus Neomarinimicrobiota bacterium]MCF7829574.1 N-6 DNA methylase [Candidatus Neomarinimicrobiota bacterium]MCF7882024.1 N-6 DNA methylase [Candidatus Neomarinimicrobiota bacterium]